MSIRPLVLAFALAAGCTFAIGGQPDVPVQLPPAGDSSPSGGGADLALPAPVTDDGGLMSSPPDLSPVPLGGACSRDADCGSAGRCLVSSDGITFPAGYCSVACSANASGCPAGSTCVGVGESYYCLAACPPAGCRTGYTCCQKEPVCAPVGACKD